MENCFNITSKHVNNTMIITKVLILFALIDNIEQTKCVLSLKVLVADSMIANKLKLYFKTNH